MPGYLLYFAAEKKPTLNWKQKKIEAEAEKPLILKIPFSGKKNSI